MAEEESSVMKITFIANGMFYDTISRVIDKAIEDGTIAKSLPLKFAGAKFKIIGNIDKVLTLQVGYDKDKGDYKELGVAISEVAGGLIGAALGAPAGRMFATAALPETGGWLWGPVAGSVAGDYFGGLAGKEVGKYLAENKKVTLNFWGIGEVNIGITTDEGAVIGEPDPVTPLPTESWIIQQQTQTMQNAVRTQLPTPPKQLDFYDPNLFSTMVSLFQPVKPGDTYDAVNNIWYTPSSGSIIMQWGSSIQLTMDKYQDGSVSRQLISGDSSALYIQYANGSVHSQVQWNNSAETYSSDTYPDGRQQIFGRYADGSSYFYCNFAENVVNGQLQYTDIGQLNYVQFHSADGSDVSRCWGNNGDNFIVQVVDGTSYIYSSNSQQFTIADITGLTPENLPNVDEPGSIQWPNLSGDQTFEHSSSGPQTMIGGEGNDNYVVDNIGDLVIENVDEGTDFVLSSITYKLGNNVENLTLTGTDNINGTGNNLNNTITGNSGNDILDGGVGADTMIGDAGDDTYVVDNIGDVVIENANEGTDTVQSSITYTLGNNVENLTLTGTGNINGTGNSLNNIITGNSGNNILDGGAGNNTLKGGLGDDTYLYGIGSGNDIIDSYEGTDANGNDKVQFGQGLTSDSFNYKQSGQDLILQIKTSGETLTFTNWFSGADYQVDSFLFADSSTMTAAQVTSRVSGAGTITGTSGNDTLTGGTGADTMAGGLGNDTYVVNNTSDVVVEDANEGTDTVQSSITYTLGANVENLTLTGTSNLNGTGNTLANVLTGNSGNNILDGGAGADTIIGGAGNDTYVVDNAADVVTENASEGTDLVQSSITYTLGNNVENLTLTGTGNVNGTGNSLNNVITGNSGNNILDGGAGNDTLKGGLGDDTYLYGTSSGNDTINSYEGTGTNGTDKVQFGQGLTSDSFNYKQSGQDLILQIKTSGETLTFTNWFSGADYQVDSFLFADNSTMTAAQVTSRVSGTGTITGTAGNDTLTGGIGADTMAGGLGNDTYVVNNTGDVVIENANEGADTVQSSITYSLGANVENLTLAGTSNLNGTGNTLANVLTGNSGDNILDGGAGADTMIGGAGNDTYVVDNTGDVVTENANEGTDTVQSSIAYTLGNNVENLSLTGTGNVNGTGNSLNNVITGNSGNNILDGGAGNDTLKGGLGDDTYLYGTGSGNDTINSYEGTGVNGNDKVQFGQGLTSDSFIYKQSGQDLVLQIKTSGETLTFTNWFSGADYQVDSFLFADSSTMTAAQVTSRVNGTGTITGTAGNDTLTGGIGADTMAGGLGNDTYVVNNTGDVIVENANEGTDTVQSSIIYTLGANVENLTLTGTANINGTGNALNNIITGNSGNNILDGGAGADTMIGGVGNDTYVVDNAADVVTENANEGTDLVQSSITYTLGNNVENLTLTGAGIINGTGNSLNNIIIGNSGDNILDGGAGADTMIGGAGNDTYIVDNAGDVVTENANEGTDVVQSSITYTLGNNVENLTLTGTSNINGTGNSLNNIITGNSGNNILDGGAGNDALKGGLGDDTYLYGTGSGNDIIDSYEGTGTNGTDKVQFGQGLTSDSFNYKQSGQDLVLQIKTSGETLTFTNWFSGADYQVDSFLFADSSTMTAAQVTSRVSGEDTTTTTTITGTAGKNTLNGSANDDVIYGLGGNDILYGNGGNDILDGGAGADKMIGGIGNDTYIVDNIGDVITENANEGVDIVQSSKNYTLGANVENLTLTGKSNISGTGNSLNNIIIGNSGKNILNGGAGVDTMIGGLGDDTYTVDNVGDVITENANEGYDVVESSVSYTLSANLEELYLTGTANINGTGNELDNYIEGNNGNNILIGGAGNDTLDGVQGADTMIGGTGDDYYTVDNVGDVITENVNEGHDAIESSVSYTLSDNVEELYLTGTTNINGIGNGLDNYMEGNDGNNSLKGGAGNDVLYGGAGNDVLEGGLGDDTYIFGIGSGNDTINSYVGANANNGSDTLEFQDVALSSVSFTKNANNLICTMNQTGETIRLSNWLLGENYQVDQFEFSDGTLTAAEASKKAV